MQFDQEGTLSRNQLVAVPARSTDVIDRGVADIPKHATSAFVADAGKGNKACIRVQITETFTGAFTALVVALEVDDNSGFSSPKIVQSQTVVKALAVAGFVFSFDQLPIGVDERFVSMNYTFTGTATATAGRITAGVTTGNDERF